MEYGTVEAILADHFHVREGIKAFRSRLRVLRDKGIPSVEKPGKGSRVTYSFKDVWELRFALDLESIGLTPMRVKILVEDAVKILVQDADHDLIDKVRKEEKKCGSDIWIVIQSINLNPSDPDGGFTLIDLMSLKELTIEFTERESGAATLCIVNLTRLTQEVERGIVKHAE
jgi:hypothetical protein